MVPSAFVPLVAAAALWGAEPITAHRDVAETRPPGQWSGTIVFLENGNRLNTVDVASGHRSTRTIRALAACGPDMHVVGGRIVFSGVRKEQTIVYSIPVGLNRPPTRLGAAHAFVPVAGERGIWLAGTDCDRPAMVGVTKATARGQVEFASTRRVPSGWIAGAVRKGLVMQNGRSAFLWSPRTGRRSGRLPLEQVITARGKLVAGCPPSSRCRDLTIVDTSSSHAQRARLSGGLRLSGEAQFSPDASVLAAPVVRGDRWKVGLIDVGSGKVEIVPGSETGHLYPELSWSASGWLYFRAPKNRVMAYRPGATKAIALPLRLPRQAAVFLAG